MVEGKWWRTLLSDSRSVVERLRHEPLIEIANLRSQVVAYRAQIRRQARPVTDVVTANALGLASLALLDQIADAPPAARHLAQIAVRYFVLQDDGDDDLGSPFGFDDDVEVFNAVVRALGLPDRALGFGPGPFGIA